MTQSENAVLVKLSFTFAVVGEHMTGAAGYSHFLFSVVEHFLMYVEAIEGHIRNLLFHKSLFIYCDCGT